MTEINTDASGVVARAHVKLPDGAARLTAVCSGVPARVPSLTSGPAAGKGTSVPKGGVQTKIQPHFGPKPIPNPYNYMTRASALGGGDLGPHPAREPEPV